MLEYIPDSSFYEIIKHTNGLCSEGKIYYMTKDNNLYYTITGFLYLQKPGGIGKTDKQTNY
jgi:hypothetical protein